jgi:hypothetical protein
MGTVTVYLKGPHTDLATKHHVNFLLAYPKNYASAG